MQGVQFILWKHKRPYLKPKADQVGWTLSGSRKRRMEHAQGARRVGGTFGGRALWSRYFRFRSHMNSPAIWEKRLLVFASFVFCVVAGKRISCGIRTDSNLAVEACRERRASTSRAGRAERWHGGVGVLGIGWLGQTRRCQRLEEIEASLEKGSGRIERGTFYKELVAASYKEFGKTGLERRVLFPRVMR